LTAGDPNKKIKGSEMDAELAEIQTAILSKEDKASKGIANGYASLDSNGDVPDAQLASNIPRTGASNVFTVAQKIEGADPQFWLNESDQAVDNKKWRVAVAGGTTYFQLMNDAESTANSWLAVTRSGITATAIQIVANSTSITGTLSVSSSFAAASGTLGGLSILTTGSGLNASNINSGSIGSAYVPVGAVTQHQGSLSIATSQLTGTLANGTVAASNVTQHQASLTIAETQISDGSTLARNAGNETISGAWTISGSLTRSSQGRYTYLVGSGNTGGAITLSTAAASGTPSNGDIWIQHAA
jgi:hypothetical protein